MFVLYVRRLFLLVTVATHQVRPPPARHQKLISFCITGNQLLLKSTDANGNESVLTATK
jgi:hypothetical protein